MADSSMFVILEQYLPEQIRSYIETNYYALVSQQAQLDFIAQNDEFLSDPINHVAFYSDHGVVHVRDVATNILLVLESIDGVLIPKRSAVRLQFMKGFGVALAYNHDIGMKNLSAFGRAMHPEFACQEVFAEHFDAIVDRIWDENFGNIAWRLVNLGNLGIVQTPLKLMLRELLSVSVGHSKSKVPLLALNDPKELRKVLLAATGTNLRYLYLKQQVAKAEKHAEKQATDAANQALQERRRQLADYEKSQNPLLNDTARRWYKDFEAEAFSWLLLDHPDIRELIDDMVDTIRALRVADALRQRGTTLKTSAGYTILTDQNSARAVFGLRKGTGELYMVESTNPLSAGEANIASSELDHTGSMRFSFARGSFADANTTRLGAYYVALVIDDVQRDIIETFQLPPEQTEGLKRNEDIEILIESTDDNLEFGDLVLDELRKINPALERRSRVVPSLKNVHPLERDLYLSAEELNWSDEERQRLLLRVAQTGYPIETISLSAAFVDVRICHVRQDEILIEAGAPPGFVYIPLNEGLTSYPLGGYNPYDVHAYMLVGQTRVIRGALQEETIAVQKDLSVLMIPKEIYLKAWHRTYDIAEFSAMLPRLYKDGGILGLPQIVSILKQLAMIDGKLEEQEAEFIHKFAETWGMDISIEQLRQEILAGGKADFIALRQSVEAYLALEPAMLQAAQLRDVVVELVGIDSGVDENEALIIAELMGILANYLDGSKELHRYAVLLVPQDEGQDQAIRALLPHLEKLSISGGKAYQVGTYYAHDYAEMIANRYRSLNLFTAIEVL